MTATCDDAVLLANVRVGGIARSTDGGIWGLHASYCSAVAFSGDAMLVAAATDHFAAHSALVDRAGCLYMSDQRGEWTCGTTGLPVPSSVPVCR